MIYIKMMINETLSNKNNEQEIISCNEALNNYNRELLFYEKLKRKS